MSDYATAEEESTDVKPRLRRGVCERMTVMHEGGEVYSVTSESGREYTVDAGSRVAATDGGIVDAGDDGVILTDDENDDGELIAAVSPAAPGDWIPVTIEFPAGVLNAAARNRVERQPVADWIRGAVMIRFSAIDRELEIQPPVRVDVPPAVAQRARLCAEYNVARNHGENYHDALRDALHGLVQPQTEYLVDGDPIASFANPCRRRPRLHAILTFANTPIATAPTGRVRS